MTSRREILVPFVAWVALVALALLSASGLLSAAGTAGSLAIATTKALVIAGAFMGLFRASVTARAAVATAVILFLTMLWLVERDVTRRADPIVVRDETR